MFQSEITSQNKSNISYLIYTAMYQMRQPWISITFAANTKIIHGGSFEMPWGAFREIISWCHVVSQREETLRMAGDRSLTPGRGNYVQWYYFRFFYQQGQRSHFSATFVYTAKNNYLAKASDYEIRSLHFIQKWSFIQYQTETDWRFLYIIVTVAYLQLVNIVTK